MSVAYEIHPIFYTVTFPSFPPNRRPSRKAKRKVKGILQLKEPAASARLTIARRKAHMVSSMAPSTLLTTAAKAICATAEVTKRPRREALVAT